MNPNPFALLNHLTLPLIRDTFLTPGGLWIRGDTAVRRPIFLLLVLPLLLGGSSEHRMMYPMCSTPLYPLLWLCNYCALHRHGMSTKTKDSGNIGLQKE